MPFLEENFHHATPRGICHNINFQNVRFYLPVDKLRPSTLGKTELNDFLPFLAK